MVSPGQGCGNPWERKRWRILGGRVIYERVFLDDFINPIEEKKSRSLDKPQRVQKTSDPR
jgi:hypothetical protein